MVSCSPHHLFSHSRSFERACAWRRLRWLWRVLTGPLVSWVERVVLEEEEVLDLEVEGLELEVEDLDMEVVLEPLVLKEDLEPEEEEGVVDLVVAAVEVLTEDLEREEEEAGVDLVLVAVEVLTEALVMEEVVGEPEEGEAAGEVVGEPEEEQAVVGVAVEVLTEARVLEERLEREEGVAVEVVDFRADGDMVEDLAQYVVLVLAEV